MERTRRLAVHVHEALQLASDSEDADRLRLSLLLFDSAAEVMLFRECDYLLRWQRVQANSLERLEAAVAAGYEGDDEYLAELRASALSKNRVRRIEREFNEKANYLVDGGLLSSGHARVLKKLHQYRNESYHEEKVRPETLLASVRIYGYIVCHMMQSLPVHIMSMTGKPLPPILQEYLSETGGHFDVQRELGAGLQARWSAMSGISVGDALADHVTARINDLRETLDWVPTELSEISDQRWTAESVVRFVQLPDDSDPFITQAEILRFDAPVTVGDLDSWEQEGLQLRLVDDELSAFSQFADLEDEFEGFESAVMQFAGSVDQEIQHRLDVARGK